MRAQVHQYRHTWGKEPGSGTLTRLNATVSRLERKEHHVVGGRNMFYQEFMAAAKDNGALKVMTQQEVMTLHMDAWSALRPQEKRKYDGLAARQTRPNQSNLEIDLINARETCKLYEERAAKERAETGKLNNVGETRYTDDDFERIASQIADGRFPTALTKQRLKTMLSSPAPVPQVQFDALKTMGMNTHGPADPGPHWLRIVARQRDALYKCVLQQTLGDGTLGQGFKYLYALQSPSHAVFLRLTIEPMDCTSAGFRDRWSAASRERRWQWTYEAGDFVYGHNLGCAADGADLQVLKYRKRALPALGHALPA